VTEARWVIILNAVMSHPFVLAYLGHISALANIEISVCLVHRLAFRRSTLQRPKAHP